MTKPRKRGNLVRLLRNQFAIFAICCALLIPVTAQTTAIRAGKLIDPDSGTVLTDPDHPHPRQQNRSRRQQRNDSGRRQSYRPQQK